MHINKIKISLFTQSSSNVDVYNNHEILEILDDAIVQYNNYKDIHKLEDTTKFCLYDVPQAHMDGIAKCTVTNDLSLLANEKWYNCWF